MKTESLIAYDQKNSDIRGILCWYQSGKIAQTRKAISRKTVIKTFPE
jgi:hypothetical protein